MSPLPEGLALLRSALNNPSADFRPGQWEAISRLSSPPARLLLVQRTGWGKSIVYFLATRIARDKGAGPTILISPLLSLIRNQIATASALGLRAASINSENRPEWDIISDELRQDVVDILLIAPERLANERFRSDFLDDALHRIGLLVVDEAHCISDWGHDFRPDYRRIARIVKHLSPTTSLLATTATANDRVVSDIVEQFGGSVEVQRGPLGRKTLYLQTFDYRAPELRFAWLADHIPKLPGSGIIYTLTIHDAELVSRWLTSRGIVAPAYHSEAGDEASPVVRPELEQKLLKGEIKALVATTALGMGFDKPDIGFIIHYQRPGSVVHYYQQIGRAGRAVEKALCVLFSGVEDDDILDYFLQTAIPEHSEMEAVLTTLDQSVNGLKLSELQGAVNISKARLEKALKLLATVDPPLVHQLQSVWKRTGAAPVFDQASVERLKSLRLHERKRMQDYMAARECLMRFLTRELDDPELAPCGKCAFCRGGKVVSGDCKAETLHDARIFLKHLEIPLKPRRWIPREILTKLSMEKSRIPEDLRNEIGRSLCRWGDPEYGELIRAGKYQTYRFDDGLVAAAADMILKRWQPNPFPAWGTAIPSRRTMGLVPDFSERLCKALGIPFVPTITKIRETAQQKTMQNSAHQAANLLGAFVAVQLDDLAGQPLLLIDDLVDSGWTLTLAGLLLKQKGAGPIYPFVLARTTRND